MPLRLPSATMCPAQVLRASQALVPATSVREQGDDGRSPFLALAVCLANVVQPAAIADIRTESTSPPDPKATPAALRCLGCGGLRVVRQVPCACGALSTRQVPA